MQQNSRTGSLLDVSWQDIISLFKGQKNPERRVRRILYVVGIILFPLTAAGALWFYVRAYNRHMRDAQEIPALSLQKPITRVAMVLGGIFIWVVLAVLIFLVKQLVGILFEEDQETLLPYMILFANLVLTAIALWMFKRWQNGVLHSMQENGRFGSAKWAQPSEFADLVRKQGIYVGNQIYGYFKQGHILTVAGTRAGKFISLIAANLLGLSGFNGSIFMIDPKGEAAAVTARFQKLIGKLVLILDPWGVTGKETACYNPLDLLSGQKNPDFLIDDVSIIAEMLVPKELNGDQYWSNRSRSLISGLILHLVTSRPKEEHHLGTVWAWLRLPEEQFNELIADMAVSDDEIVQATANETIALMKASEKTFASIMSTALDKTDFLKSPALRASMQSSNFNINDLSNGRTTLYVVFPPDKLDSQGQWLRLVFATALQSVVRNRNKRVLFILDECAALGHLPLIKTALSTYAGYNVTMWPIFQDLSQIKSIYGEAWETFISNSAVRHYFGVNDVFTSEYLEKLMGQQTVVTHDGKEPKGTARPLATADEIRRASGEHIFTFVEQRPPTYFPKYPYYEMPTLKGLHDPNPYYTPSGDANKEDDIDALVMAHKANMQEKPST